MTGLLIMPRKFVEDKISRHLCHEGLDRILIYISLSLLCLGLVMVASASITVADRDIGSPFYYFNRQLMAAALGIVVVLVIANIRLVHWEKSGIALLGFAFFLLILVLIPGIGKTVNGSTRWIPMGFLNLQVSELVKLFLLVYVAGYLVRHGDEVRSSVWGFIKPMIMVGFACVLLLLEPDFGASVVIMATTLGMMFIGGVRFVQFLSFLALFGAVASLLVVSSAYRLERLTTFVNPWADPFDKGFQLTQSLIAIGSGGLTGTGIGGSVQKLFYLPEAHTDFVFAIMAEELGLIGVVFVIGLFAALLIRSFVLARNAEQNNNLFSAYLAYGIGIWLGLQAFINIGVNMGVLPTKGLTLPLMSYGGSSLIVCCAAIGLLLRISYECGGAGQAMLRTRKKSSVAARKRKQQNMSSLWEDAA
ncbi:MAG: putative lipid II flippase FtsW [Gammaproteobacteria bacterium]|nr:putative lipid II flippase FtsW [Gammaproteobacteria bacterium]